MTFFCHSQQSQDPTGTKPLRTREPDEDRQRPDPTTNLWKSKSQRRTARRRPTSKRPTRRRTTGRKSITRRITGQGGSRRRSTEGSNSHGKNQQSHRHLQWRQKQSQEIPNGIWPRPDDEPKPPEHEGPDAKGSPRPQLHQRQRCR